MSMRTADLPDLISKCKEKNGAKWLSVCRIKNILDDNLNLRQIIIGAALNSQDIKRLAVFNESSNMILVDIISSAFTGTVTNTELNAMTSAGFILTVQDGVLGDVFASAHLDLVRLNNLEFAYFLVDIVFQKIRNTAYAYNIKIDRESDLGFYDEDNLSDKLERYLAGKSVNFNDNDFVEADTPSDKKKRGTSTESNLFRDNFNEAMEIVLPFLHRHFTGEKSSRLIRTMTELIGKGKKLSSQQLAELCGIKSAASVDSMKSQIRRYLLDNGLTINLRTGRLVILL